MVLEHPGEGVDDVACGDGVAPLDVEREEASAGGDADVPAVGGAPAGDARHEGAVPVRVVPGERRVDTDAREPAAEVRQVGGAAVDEGDTDAGAVEALRPRGGRAVDEGVEGLQQRRIGCAVESHLGVRSEIGDVVVVDRPVHLVDPQCAHGGVEELELADVLRPNALEPLLCVAPVRDHLQLGVAVGRLLTQFREPRLDGVRAPRLADDAAHAGGAAVAPVEATVARTSAARRASANRARERPIGQRPQSRCIATFSPETLVRATPAGVSVVASSREIAV